MKERKNKEEEKIKEEEEINLRGTKNEIIINWYGETKNTARDNAY